MPKVSDGLKDEVARALQKGGAEAAAELLFGVARAMDREEVYSVLPADLAAFEQAIEERSRAVHPA